VVALSGQGPTFLRHFDSHGQSHAGDTIGQFCHGTNVVIADIRSMEVFLDVVRSVFPAVLMLILAYLMLSSFMENDERRRKSELRRAAQNQALPVRMQAYERLTLLLERIAPNSLLLRVQHGTLNVREYHTLLNLTIRQEFEYNLSQQIYVSADAWQMITTAKNALVSIINQTSSSLDPQAPAVDLAKRILEQTLQMETIPTTAALNFLRNEAYMEF
jgi:hypothetical protein